MTSVILVCFTYTRIERIVRYLFHTRIDVCHPGFGGMYEMPNNIHSTEQLRRWVENTRMHHVFLIKRNRF